MLLTFYILSVIYCWIRFYRWNQASSWDGVVGSSPGFTTLATLILAPVFVVVDTAITSYKWITKYDKRHEEN